MANTDLFEYSSQAVLHSEEDVKMKVIMPYLKKLGYSEKEMRFENPIKVQVGRKSVTIFSDIDLNYAYLFLNLNENVATPSFYL